MKVRLARTAGFCMGVSRAMEITLAEARKTEGPLYTLGPLIHNPQVLELLATRQVRAVEHPESLGAGRIVIRAHGIPPRLREAVKASGLRIIDATCPRVARVQAIIRYHSGRGYEPIIVGDQGHAEVIGLMGYSKTPVHVIQKVAHVAGLPSEGRFFVVAQTTQNEQTYAAVVEALQARYPDLQVFRTICEATQERQQEVRELAPQVDALVVVGGRDSGNTRRLVEIARAEGLPTFHVETHRDLDKRELARMGVIGVTAGASTPSWLIKNVVREVEAIRGRKDSRWWRLAGRAFAFLVSSNLAVAGGAASLCYAVCTLSALEVRPAFPLLTFLFIYAMYVLIRFLDKGASAFNDPEVAAFLSRHRRLLTLLGLAAAGSALVLALRVGTLTFGALGLLGLMGALYSLPLIPRPMRPRYRFSRIKDLPGSKNLSEALGWTALISLLPLIEAPDPRWPTALAVSAFVFLMALSRSMLVDIIQLQGDLIVGSETLPVVLGRRRVLRILRWTLGLASTLLVLGGLTGWLTPFAYPLLLSPLGFSLCLAAHEQRWIYPGTLFSVLLEGSFLLAGVLALIWQLWP